MPNPLLQARSRLANATRSGDPQRVAAARADLHEEKLRQAILEDGPGLTAEARGRLAKLLISQADLL